MRAHHPTPRLSARVGALQGVLVVQCRVADARPHDRKEVRIQQDLEPLDTRGTDHDLNGEAASVLTPLHLPKRVVISGRRDVVVRVRLGLFFEVDRPRLDECPPDILLVHAVDHPPAEVYSVVVPDSAADSPILAKSAIVRASNIDARILRRAAGVEALLPICVAMDLEVCHRPPQLDLEEIQALLCVGPLHLLEAPIAAVPDHMVGVVEGHQLNLGDPTRAVVQLAPLYPPVSAPDVQSYPVLVARPPDRHAVQVHYGHVGYILRLFVPIG
mmetsp:Transcript_102824/g.297275  ORF Transcript_102824/g.297275 Transcript_102824/m.297275 type:complete len:272 (-) Transcript_102824:1924-2739(-)